MGYDSWRGWIPFVTVSPLAYEHTEVIELSLEADDTLKGDVPAGLEYMSMYLQRSPVTSCHCIL
jgi:hypothetical protein